MASPEIEPKREKFWQGVVWGTIGVIAIFALIDFLGPEISKLEKTLHFAH